MKMEFFRSENLDPVDEDGELWFSIYPDIQDYLFSNHFRLKSLKFGKEKIIKFYLYNNGYLVTNIMIDGKRKGLRFHQAVCLTFKNPAQKYFYSFDEILKNYDVNHIDGNRSNNHPSNLELVKSFENYCICKNDGRTLNFEEAIEIFKLAWASNLNHEEIASLYNINQWNVSFIKTGRTWSYYTSKIDPKNIKQWEIELILKKFNKIEINKFQEADLNEFF